MLSTAEKQRRDKPANGKPARTPTRPSIPNQPVTVVAQSAAEQSGLFEADAAADGMKVSFDRRDLRLELTAGRYPLFSGPFHWELLVDRRPLDSSQDVDRACWETNCWEQNIDVSYAEMQLDLPSGLQIQRQLLLARRDRFALIADVVSTPALVDGVYRFHLPFSDQLTCVPGADARELTIYSGRRSVARVLPISLPEWRRQPGGQLQIESELTCSQPLHSGRGHIALFIDLDPRRAKRQLTWRQLTVAESMQTVARDVAAGYRIQIGKEQWLIYRSLAPAGNRTVLGQNFSTEFVVARFRPNGLAEKMLEIVGNC